MLDLEKVPRDKGPLGTPVGRHYLSMKVNEMFITIYFSTGGKLNLEGKEVIQEPQKHRDALTCLHANSTVGCVSSFNPAFTDAWCLQQLHIWGLGQESIFSLAFPAD